MGAYLWNQAIGLLNDTSIATFGQTLTYQRPGYPAFQIPGVPEFLARLEDVNRGQFIAASFRLSDFTLATFEARAIIVFTGAPAAGGFITIDAITYTCLLQSGIHDGTPRQFWRGNVATQTASSLAAAINASAPQEGIFSTSTTPHPTCFATASGASVTVLYRLMGIIGNGVPLSYSMSATTSDSPVLYGGGPLVGDLVTYGPVLYSVSDVPAADSEGFIEVRLLKKT